MQRRGLLARTLVFRGCSYHRTCPISGEQRASTTTLRWSSSGVNGRDHDDFWTEIKTDAEATPAYQKAASIARAPAAGRGGYEWATPGGLPAGEAYGPDSDESSEPLPTIPPDVIARFDAKAKETRNFENKPRTGDFDMKSPLHLSPTKQVRVRLFKGKILVDIRTFLTADSTLAAYPTKKGASLTIEQWERLKAAINTVDIEIAKVKEEHLEDLPDA